MNAPVSVEHLLPALDHRHLDWLEEEAIFVLRETAASFERPALLFSGGKDSCVVLRLAEKAFKTRGADGRFHGKLPFPLLHVDTGHNFPEVIEFRDRRVAEMGETLVVGSVEESIRRGTVRLSHPLESRNGHQTVALLEAIEEHRFDALLGGARRDEEKARAKERIFSHRDAFGQWQPKEQRPELWTLFNTRIRPGEHMRIFPISNWTELDVWLYIARERIPLPELYYAHPRRVMRRKGLLVPLTEVTPALPGEEVETVDVRFRTVGDMTCTCPVESPAASAAEVVAETLQVTISERGATRMDDRTSEASMERRKKEGYFLMAAVLDEPLPTTATVRVAGSGCTDHRALRFLTAGSVDDGKSTLIGRLLYDSRAILADQLDTLAKKAKGEARAAGEPNFDLSLLTDGLEAEREQGITIDVAYRYFATRERKFIIADAPGHEQYTRNMVTAAAGSDAAVVLVDLTKLDTSAQPVALLPQTRRHALLAHLLRVPGIVFAVNKIDAVADAGRAFHALREALSAFAAQAGIAVAGIVPVSALRGDNVTTPLEADWYDGPSLLQLLESLPTLQERSDEPLLVPIQYVAREGDGIGHQPRTLWGRIAHGRVRAGDAVQVVPSGETAVVAEVRLAGSTVEHAEAGQSAGLVLDRQLDVSRGDWIATPGSVRTTNRFAATLAWLDTEPAKVARKYWVRHGNRWVQARIVSVEHRLDIHTLQPTEAHDLGVNEIGQVVVETQQPIPVESFAHNRAAGALIVVDPASHRTSGTLLVEGDA